MGRARCGWHPMATSSSRKPAREEFASCARLTETPSRRQPRFTRARLTGRSGSPFTRVETILNGFTSPTPTVSFVFPTGRAISKPPGNPKPSSPSCRMATGTRPGTLLSPTTTSGCWYRSAPPATTEKGWEARPEDCKRGSANTRSARVGEARPAAPPC